MRCVACGEETTVTTCTICMADECDYCHTLTDTVGDQAGSYYIPADEVLDDYARAKAKGFEGSFGEWLHTA